MLKIALKDRDTLLVRFRYWGPYIERIRQIPGAHFDPALRAWLVGRDYAEDLEELFAGETVWLTPFHEVVGLPPPPPDPKIARIPTDPVVDLAVPLKPHQHQAVRFCLEQFEKTGFAHIWDGVGLGKTAEAIGTAEALRARASLQGPVLVVCPAPLKLQWEHEIRKFTHDRSVVVVPPVPARRQSIFEQWTSYDYVVINYELVLRDADRLARLPVGLLVADEPHEKVLNPSGKMHRALARAVKARYKLFMTATPVANDALQLFALFRLSDPKILGKRADFERRYVIYDWSNGYRRLVGYRHLDELRELGQRYAIRRTWRDIGLAFPELLHSSRTAEPSAEQLEAFEILQQERDRIRAELEALADAKDRESRLHQQRLENQLRSLAVIGMLVADAPHLVRTSKSQWARRRLGELLRRSENPKGALLEQTLRELLGEGHKVVVFTQFRKVAEDLAEWLARLFDEEVAVLSQGVPPRDREVMKARFNDGDLRLIISTPAGRTGVNLRGGSAAIHYDLPWSPSALEQREGRITRLDSQHRQAYSITLLLAGSIDEVIHRALREKQEVVDYLVPTRV